MGEVLQQQQGPLAGYSAERIFLAIRTLYSADNSIPAEQKTSAGAFLNEFQRSTEAWEIADNLLHQKNDLQACYFGAHTLRTKIQTSFFELPPTCHVPLRDSLLAHIGNIDSTTDHTIVTQLCLAVTHLILQAPSWADPIGHLMHNFGQNPQHWWPILEILTLLPEEVHSRKLQLGENRRHQVSRQLGAVSPSVMAFLKQCLNVRVGGLRDDQVFQDDHFVVAMVNCFGAWAMVNPDSFFFQQNQQQQDGSGGGAMEMLNFVIRCLRVATCPQKLHAAATDTLCNVSEVIPDMDTTANNNSGGNNNVNNEGQLLQLALHNALMAFGEPYAIAVAEEDQDKVINYTRIFTEYGENMVGHMLRSSRDPHYSIHIIDRILESAGHHDYEVAENTFGFWYRLGEDLFHSHDEGLITLFRPYAARLIHALYKHCFIEPDHEGPLKPTDDFYEFRKKAAEVVEDFLFVVGPLQAFSELGRFFINEQSWDAKEAALFLLYHVAKSPDVETEPSILPFLEALLSFSDWRHVCLKLTAIRLLGGLAAWLNNFPQDVLGKALDMLVSSLPQPEYSVAASAALQNICQSCANHIAAQYMNNLLNIVAQMDLHNVGNEAVVGILRGVGHVVGTLPGEQLAVVIRQICLAQIQPLAELCDDPTHYSKNTKTDPVFWVDRLSALFRTSAGDNNSTPRPPMLEPHPCSQAICEDFWPAISRVCSKYKADPRTMERVCRCLRYAVRCVGKNSHPFLEPLAVQLVTIYREHPHSCLLYMGSILVDEYGEESQCVDFLLLMLSQFVPPTFTLLNEPGGLRNHPDTVDDFFRLCARFLQRCPLTILQSDVIIPLVQCAIHAATQLDHREANISVMKFLYDFAHCGRKQKDSPDFPQRQALSKDLLRQTAPQLIQELIHGAIFTLPSYTLNDIAELLYEVREVMGEDAERWLSDALQKLPTQTVVGGMTATLEQRTEFQRVVRGARSPKEISRATKQFCRFFR